jgi:imidazole glycerol-phosphate synthase subunit HisH
MNAGIAPRVAIVDYHLGNLFSVKHACGHVGLDAVITADRAVIESADAIILPGVGAFGDAMKSLTAEGLVEPLRELAASDTPFLGICLGLQLLFTESEEFGTHAGLGIVPGRVVRFPDLGTSAGRRRKVPHVGWARVNRPAGTSWDGTVLAGLADGHYEYFVHSYHVAPENRADVLTTSTYGEQEFCSAVKRGNVTAFQYHPERSGARGLRVYRNLHAQLCARIKAKERRHVA